MAGMAQQLRSRRFETRLDARTDDLIARAAEARGETRSAFVVRAAREAAERSLGGPETPAAQASLLALLEGVDDTALAACPLLKGLRHPVA